MTTHIAQISNTSSVHILLSAEPYGYSVEMSSVERPAVQPQTVCLTSTEAVRLALAILNREHHLEMA